LQAAPRGQISVAQVGAEPTASLGLSKGGLPIAYRAGKFRGLESNQHPRVQSPMSYQLDDPGVTASLTPHLSTRFGRRSRTFIAWFKAGQPTISRSPRVPCGN